MSYIPADPIKFIKLVWPKIRLYDKQREIIYSVRDNDITVVPAGNMLGKDFISALIVLWFFNTRRPVRIVTSSVKFEQLNDVLWGEMRRLIETAEIKLPIHENYMKLRHIRNDGSFVPLTEVIGQVVKQGEAMLGRHLPNDIPRTMALFDEASAIPTTVYDSAQTWAHKSLVIGNCFPTTNFFFQAVERGDIPREDGDGYYQKVIHIKGEDSPNVKLGLKQEAAGIKPTNKVLVPGLLTYREYKKRRALWSKMLQCISLDGRFYKGEEVMLFPDTWLKHSWKLWAEQHDNFEPAKAIGADTAEGGDNTCSAIAGQRRLLELRSAKTPDTSKIQTTLLDLMNEYNVPPENVYLDQGGGGKEHADYLRAMGYDVNCVFFGKTATEDKTYLREWKSDEEKKDLNETRFTFKNKRTELYHNASRMCNPAYGGYALPPPTEGPQYAELYRQLRLMPKLLDDEGRFYLPPKRKRPNSKEQSLEELLGCSPDEADAFVLAMWGLESSEEMIYV